MSRPPRERPFLVSLSALKPQEPPRGRRLILRSCSPTAPPHSGSDPSQRDLNRIFCLFLKCVIFEYFCMGVNLNLRSFLSTAIVYSGMSIEVQTPHLRLKPDIFKTSDIQLCFA